MVIPRSNSISLFSWSRLRTFKQIIKYAIRRQCLEFLLELYIEVINNAKILTLTILTRIMSKFSSLLFSDFKRKVQVKFFSEDHTSSSKSCSMWNCPRMFGFSMAPKYESYFKCCHKTFQMQTQSSTVGFVTEDHSKILFFSKAMKEFNSSTAP